MPNTLDVHGILRNQYSDASRLDARRQLHAKYSTNPQDFYAWVFAHLHLPRACAVLEVGCGSGHLWLANGARLPADWAVTLSDVSAGMLHEAQQQLRACRHAFRFIVHDVQALPFASRGFDAIIANHMLYHVPNRSSAYAEFCRVLKPSGRLYTATSSRENMRELDELIARFRHSGSQESAATSPLSDRRVRTGFNLEHGAAELAQWFASVTLHRYADALVVPEAAPLVAYVRSTGYLTDDALAMFQRHVEAILARHGPVRISKDIGMFEASQPSAS